MLTAALWVMFVAAAAPAVPPPAPAPPAAATVQQMFDAASAAEDRGDRAGALATYDAIERRLGSKPNVASLAITRARRGVLLVALGRNEAAASALRYADANLAQSQPALRGDRYLVALSLGQVEEQALDFAAARHWYQRAEKEADATSMSTVWGAQARVTMFDDPTAALALADRALAVAASNPTAKPAALGSYHTLRGRVLLNARDYKAAQAELKKAVADLGGLTQRIDLNDVAARSDYAIAAMLNHDEDSARQYLAFTGAGTQRDVLSPSSEGQAPPCGGPADLRPEDAAVIEFAIGEDGSVTGVAPIYASRNGAAAQEFARAVAGWSWTREEAAKIKPFFRAFVRMELHCSVSAKRPDVADLFEPAVEQWLKATSVDPYEPSQSSAALALAPAEAELRRRQAAFGASSPALLPPIRAIVRNQVSDFEGSKALAARAIAIAETAGAPSGVIAYYALLEAGVTTRSGKAAPEQARRLALLDAAVRRPDIAGNPPARAAVRVRYADMLTNTKGRASALPLLQQVVDDMALDPRDPLKVGAWLRLASIRATQGDLAGAREAYQRTGLAAQECALVDAKPALVKDNAGASSFPMEALRWGFEGWAQTEFDIAADGRTANVRTVIAYPPFVFTPAASKILAGARFTQSYRPEGGLGCGGLTQRVRFGLPSKR